VRALLAGIDRLGCDLLKRIDKLPALQISGYVADWLVRRQAMRLSTAFDRTGCVVGDAATTIYVACGEIKTDYPYSCFPA